MGLAHGGWGEVRRVGAASTQKGTGTAAPQQVREGTRGIASCSLQHSPLSRWEAEAYVSNSQLTKGRGSGLNAGKWGGWGLGYSCPPTLTLGSCDSDPACLALQVL